MSWSTLNAHLQRQDALWCQLGKNSRGQAGLSGPGSYNPIYKWGYSTYNCFFGPFTQWGPHPHVEKKTCTNGPAEWTGPRTCLLSPHPTSSVHRLWSDTTGMARKSAQRFHQFSCSWWCSSWWKHGYLPRVYIMVMSFGTSFPSGFMEKKRIVLLQ